MIRLIGNYSADGQESMLRFAKLLKAQLEFRGEKVEVMAPRAVVSRFLSRRSIFWKCAGYFDKFILFPARLRSHPFAREDVVHICDHSNAVYARWFRRSPVVVTCHDLLAVRGGLGEETDCPATPMGRLLQRWILRSLKRANALACVSEATATDARRLLDQSMGTPKLMVVPNGLNYPYGEIPLDEAWSRLGQFPRLQQDRPFILHVGSSLRRKNRDGFIRALALANKNWKAQAVFAGEALSLDLCRQARRAKVETVEIIAPDSPILEALYRVAHALLFPSRFEGFGWPIIEAQACGCPVVCSMESPMAEIAGAGARRRNSSDDEGFAREILALRDPGLRARQRELGFENVTKYEPKMMAERYLEVYRQVGGPA